MRILNVLNYYTPYTSGLSNFARQLAEQCVAGGHTVTTLTGRHRSDLAEEEEIGGVRVIRARPLLFLHKGYISPDFVGRSRTLASAADLVILHAPMLEAAAIALAAPRRVPLVLLYHCEVVPSREFRVVDWAAIRTVRASCRIAAKRADRIVVTSLDFAKTSKVLRGLEAKFFELHPMDNVGRVDVRNAGVRDRPRVGFLGRFVEEKGIDVLLRAVQFVAERAPNVEFVLGGEYREVAGRSKIDELKPLLERVKQWVKLPGRIPDEELSDFYRSLDVFVLPSINSYESFGMVQVEAMKHGVPVVVSDLPGVRVPVQLTRNGTLVAPGDPIGLASAILEQLHNPCGTPEQIASRAWAVFSAEQRQKKLTDLLGSC
ncbi:MAG: glycosyltransferase family 4 protein [Bryobacterales bacterium]|nr:glycosyltransferase family 4 protein [Bryobacterales bacterium]